MPVSAGDIIRAADMNKATDQRIATTSATSDGSASSGTTEALVDTVTFTAVSGYTYKLEAYFPGAGSVALDRFLIRIREGNGTSGTQVTYWTLYASGTNAADVARPATDWVSGTSGSQTFSVTMQRTSGTGTLTPKGSTTQPRTLTVSYVEG